MNFDDLMFMCILGSGLAMFYFGLYKFGLFYHSRQIERAKDEFKENLHKPHFFGDGQ